MVVRLHTALFLVLIAVLVVAPAHSQAGESDGDRLVEWLLANPTHAEFDARLAEAVDSVTTVARARALASALPRLLVTPDALERYALALAPILRTAREFTAARGLYAMAFMASGEQNLEAQFARAQLSLQLGELSLADQLARDVLARTDDYELKRRSYALVARALHADGRHAEAAGMVETLVALDDPLLVEPETLLLKERVERALGNSYSADQALAQSHPDSVAAQLFTNPQVGASALPIRFLEFSEVGSPVVPDVLPSEARTPDTRAVSVTGIQVGSFRDPDNAHHMERDIEELDLAAEVRTQTREGQTIYTVVVGLDGGSSDVVRTMEQLQTAGYDGFLIY